MLYKSLNLTHIKWHNTGEALSDFFGSYEGFISHEIKSLYQHKSQQIY